MKSYYIPDLDHTWRDILLLQISLAKESIQTLAVGESYHYYEFIVLRDRLRSIHAQSRIAECYKLEGFPRSMLTRAKNNQMRYGHFKWQIQSLIEESDDFSLPNASVKEIQKFLPKVTECICALEQYVLK